MTAEPTGDDDVFVVRVMVDDELFVRGVCVQTGRECHLRSVCCGEAAVEERSESVFVLSTWLAGHLVRVDRLIEMIVLADLHAGDVKTWKAIIKLVFATLDDEYGKRIGCEPFRDGWLEPAKHLALWFEAVAELGQELWCPCPGGDNQFFCGVGVAVSLDTYAPVIVLPVEYLLTGVNGPTLAVSSIDMGNDTLLGPEESAIGLMEYIEVGRELEPGEPFSEFGSVQNLMFESVSLTGLFSPGDSIRVGATGRKRAGRVEKGTVVTRVEFMPQLVGPTEQRYVVRMFVVRLSDDAGDAVRGAHCVRHIVPFESKDSHVALCEVVRSGTTHAADTHHDDVVVSVSHVLRIARLRR